MGLATVLAAAVDKVRSPIKAELTNVDALRAYLSADRDRFVLDSTPLDKPLKNIVTFAGSQYVPYADYSLMSRINACAPIDKKAFDEALADSGYVQVKSKPHVWHWPRQTDVYSIYSDEKEHGLLVQMGEGWMSNRIITPQLFRDDLRDYLEFVRDAIAASYASFGVPCPKTTVRLSAPR